MFTLPKNWEDLIITKRFEDINEYGEVGYIELYFKINNLFISATEYIVIPGINNIWSLTKKEEFIDNAFISKKKDLINIIKGVDLKDKIIPFTYRNK